MCTIKSAGRTPATNFIRESDYTGLQATTKPNQPAPTPPSSNQPAPTPRTSNQSTNQQTNHRRPTNQQTTDVQSTSKPSTIERRPNDRQSNDVQPTAKPPTIERPPNKRQSTQIIENPPKQSRINPKNRQSRQRYPADNQSSDRNGQEIEPSAIMEDRARRKIALVESLAGRHNKTANVYVRAVSVSGNPILTKSLQTER
jgi:hypothetical protein